MKRTLSLILAFCIAMSCAVLLIGCDKTGSSAGYPVTINDTTIKKEPKKIVVLNDELADIISYIGYDIKMVGRSAECDQEFLHVVPTMGVAASPDVKAITDAGTDLVVADNTLSANIRQTLEQAGVTVLSITPPTTLEELHTVYVNLGTALGGSENGALKGENGFNDLHKMLDTLNTASSNVVQTAAYLYLDGSGQLCTLIKDSLEYVIFNFNGCSNVFVNQTEPVVNAKELKLSSPNYIFYDTPEVLEYLKKTPDFAKLSGLVKNQTLQIPIKQFRRHGSTAEQTVFQMLNYIEKITKATPDEATQAPTKAPETKAPETKAPETNAPETKAPETEAPETEAQEQAYYEEAYDNNYNYYNEYDYYTDDSYLYY